MFKPDNITPENEIFIELKTIQEYLESSEISEGDGLVDRAHNLRIYLARTGKLLADSKYHADTMVNSEIMRLLRENVELPASTMNNFIKSACKNLNYLVDWSERMNRAITHEIELMRSLISKEKTEMQFSR